MKKKILYGVGGVFVLLILIGVIAPEPDKSTQNVEQNTFAVEAVATTTATSTPEVAKAKEVVVQPQIQTSQPVATPQDKYYLITSVVDGDTVKVNISGKEETLRLIGMDTPETVDPRKPVQCFGKEASNKAKELLSGKRVRLEMDPSQGTLDKYERTLAYIHRDDGLFYNKYMIEQGYAHEYTYNTPYKYQVEFKAAQRSAQANQLGLWSPTTCNGDTTSSNSSTQTAPDTTQAGGKYYTSSYYSSKYYYPEACDGWKSLSDKYLRSYDSIDALLATYPSRTLSPQCQ